MNHFLSGFADELSKHAGVAKAVRKTFFKNPRRAIYTALGAGVLGSTAMAASGAHKEGLRGGEKGRYLAATRDRPSAAALRNHHRHFKHKPSAKEVRKLSKYHKASRFSSYSSRPKTKKKDKS